MKYSIIKLSSSTTNRTKQATLRVDEELEKFRIKWYVPSIPFTWGNPLVVSTRKVKPEWKWVIQKARYLAYPPVSRNTKTTKRTKFASEKHNDLLDLWFVTEKCSTSGRLETIVNWVRSGSAATATSHDVALFFPSNFPPPSERTHPFQKVLHRHFRHLSTVASMVLSCCSNSRSSCLILIENTAPFCDIRFMPAVFSPCITRKAR